MGLEALSLQLILALAFVVFVVWLFFRLKRRKRYDLARITLKDIDQMSGHEFEDYLAVFFLLRLALKKYIVQKKS